MLIFDPIIISKFTRQYNTTITLTSHKIPQPDKRAVDNNKKENENKQNNSANKKDINNFNGEGVNTVNTYEEGLKKLRF